MVASLSRKQKAKAEAFAFSRAPRILRVIHGRDARATLVSNHQSLGKTIVNCASIRIDQGEAQTEAEWNQ